MKIGGRSISDLVEMPVIRLKQWFDKLELTEQEQEIGKRLLTEINSRLQFLLDVGLGYLTLNRMSNSLSGGESQRINLTTSLGSSLVGSLYILDEPSIGLHSRDTDRLIKVLKELQALGNTVPQEPYRQIPVAPRGDTCSQESPPLESENRHQRGTYEQPARHRCVHTPERDDGGDRGQRQW